MHIKDTPQRIKLSSKFEIHKELNSSESGIYAGASTSSNEVESKSKKLASHNNNISDVDLDENFEFDELEFKDNDFISSTLLLNS